MFHESHPQPFRCSELLWSLAGPGSFLYFAFILPQMCPQTWCHKFLGFSHLCVVLLLSQPTPRSLQISLQLLHSPAPFSKTPFRFWGADKAPMCPQAHGREDVSSHCASQTPVSHWLFSKINPLNKKCYQQEHNQISDRRSLDE